MSKLIDGRALAEKIRTEIRNEIIEKKLTPSLAIVLVGDDQASHLYVKLKEKACAEVGIDFHKYYLPEDAKQETLFQTIDFLNNDPEISAIVLQLPLPSHLDDDASVARISPDKDADGFGPQNLKDFLEYKARIIPGLPNGIYELIKSTGEKLEGKHCVVIANSEVFSKPIGNMMLYKGATGEYVNPNDPKLTEKTQKADIIVIAIGRKWFLKPEMIKEGAIIIDVGINKDGNATFGDVDPEVDEIAAFRSPVPGGVGPMTIAMLIRNTVELHKFQRK